MDDFETAFGKIDDSANATKPTDEDIRLELTMKPFTNCSVDFTGPFFTNQGCGKACLNDTCACSRLHPTFVILRWFSH